MCPNLADLAANLHGATVFSKLDLRKGYPQVPVHPRDVAMTAVVTPFGLFEYLCMLFGLRNAGQTLQRLMDEILKDVPHVFVYMDDILVASATWSMCETCILSCPASRSTGWSSTERSACWGSARTNT